MDGCVTHRDSPELCDVVCETGFSGGLHLAAVEQGRGDPPLRHEHDVKTHGVMPISNSRTLNVEANHREAVVLLRTFTSRQRRGIEQLARQKNRRCDNCGSSELVSADEVLLTLGPIEVDLSCQDCGTPNQLPLTIEEAKSLGIVRMRDRPETTG